MGTSTVSGLALGTAPRYGESRPESSKAMRVPAGDGVAGPAADIVRVGGNANSRPVVQALRALAARIVEASRDTHAARGTGERGAQQVFDFFVEARAAQSLEFRQRIVRTANGIGDDDRRANLVEVSRHVAARFDASLSISARVLGGFSGGAESLRDSPDLEEFLALTKTLLGELDEVLNEFFGNLAEIFQGGTEIQRFANELNAAFAGFTHRINETAQLSGLQLEFSFRASIEVSVRGSVQESDPIVLDLDGDGIELTSYRNGARFDIEARGRIVQTAFVTGGDAFLALDRNGNGVIDDGAELFGDQRSAANGFEALRALDSNRDGIIDQRDADFDALLLFRDDGDGQTEQGELIGLAEAGVESISLDYRNVHEAAAGGNRIEQTAVFRRSDGTEGRAADAILNFLA